MIAAVGERFHADAFELHGHVGRPRSRRRDLRVENGVHDRGVRHASPQLPSRRRFPEHDADGEDVGSPVDALGQKLLGRHVANLAFDDPRIRFVTRVLELRDAEIQNAYFALDRNEDVVRRHVAMHDAERRPVVIRELVGVMQTVQRFAKDAQVRRERQRHTAGRRSLDDARERLALEIFHDDDGPTFFFEHFVRLHDVRMVETSRQASFIEKHAPQIAVV